MAPRPTPGIALRPAKDLRARADRAATRAARPKIGSPRARFLHEQRRRVVSRLVPTLAAFALGSGAAAFGDLVTGGTASRTTAVAEGVTSVVIASLAAIAALTRRRVAVLHAVTVAGGLAHVVGWSIVQSVTGGAKSPYALAVPFGVAVLTVLVPLPWQLALVVTAAGAVGLALAAPGAPLAAFVVFAVLFAGSVVLARQRRRRDLVAFRRIQRVASVAKLRRVQDELVVVEKLEALLVLVGGMAHEMNNALTVSTAYTDRIRASAESDPAGVLSAAERVSKSLDRIRTTIERLRRFASAEEQVLEPADVCAIVDFALESAVGRSRAGIEIERHYEDGLGPVACHVSALAEALVQVAKNAVEAMPEGGTLRVRARREGDHVVLSIADEGKGIPKEQLSRVFDPFFAREEGEEVADGRVLPALPGKPGLGLSTVYGIVRAIGGEVRLASDVGKGTEVTILLPVSS